MDPELIRQLKKFIDEDLDQWERFRMESTSGPVWINIDRECIYGPESAYDVLGDHSSNG